MKKLIVLIVFLLSMAVPVLATIQHPHGSHEAKWFASGGSINLFGKLDLSSYKVKSTNFEGIAFQNPADARGSTKVITIIRYGFYSKGWINGKFTQISAVGLKKPFCSSLTADRVDCSFQKGVLIISTQDGKYNRMELTYYHFVIENGKIASVDGMIGEVKVLDVTGINVNKFWFF